MAEEGTFVEERHDMTLLSLLWDLMMDFFSHFEKSYKGHEVSRMKLPVASPPLP